MIFELATSFADICKSFLMVAVNQRRATRSELLLICHHPKAKGGNRLTKGGKAYQDRKATMNPIQEKKKTRPQGSIGLSIGIDLAFLLTGLTSGETKRSFSLEKSILQFHASRYRATMVIVYSSNQDRSEPNSRRSRRGVRSNSSIFNYIRIPGTNRVNETSSQFYQQ